MKRNIFIVMCMSTCILFTVQCGNDDRTDVVPPEIPGGIEELPGEDEDSPVEPTGHVDVEAEVDASYDKLFESVECPSPAKTGKAYDLVGKWKLILRINGTDTVDCSCEDIVYHFKPDQMLTTSIGDETGEDVAYEYEWGYPFCPRCLPITPRPNLRMGNSMIYCWALLKKLFIYPQLDPEREGWPLRKIQWLFIRID